MLNNILRQGLIISIEEINDLTIDKLIRGKEEVREFMPEKRLSL